MDNSGLFPKGINPDDLDPTTRKAFEKLHEFGSLPPEELQKHIDDFEQEQSAKGIHYDERDGVDDVTWDEYLEAHDKIMKSEEELFGNAPKNPPEN